jgi:hypothetical protein
MDTQFFVCLHITTRLNYVTGVSTLRATWKCDILPMKWYAPCNNRRLFFSFILLLLYCSGHPFARAHFRILGICWQVHNVDHVCHEHWRTTIKRNIHAKERYSGHPFARAHCRTFRWPPEAAPIHVHLSQGHPFVRSHLRTSKCPFAAALEHIHASQGHPFSCAHLRTSSCPFLAALEHVHRSQGHPFARSHLRTSR